ncbi:PREDICTED: uncharacterized protein LOC109157790 [Ipomoea nil]|uniref:uncharacterized protein LOC109157790 n=1 Tax=Ipomoea nil TaxID=35883 RepID=UPI000900F98B|nr:PREDICTED: uncharacterized protein LOC109157790 [Ipomoea nil]
MGSDSACENGLVAKMGSEFKIRDMGRLSFFLGIETIPVDDGLLLSQQHYMKDILKRAGMVDCKALVTPVSLTRVDDGVVIPYADLTQYRSLAGALQYLTVTRPDSFAVNRSFELVCLVCLLPVCGGRIIMLLEEKDVDYVIYDDPTTFILTATTAATTATATTATTGATDKSDKTAD